MTKPLQSLTDTWNDGATVFAAIQMNVTDTASDPASLLMDLQVGGSSKFNVSKTGAITFGTGATNTLIHSKGSAFFYLQSDSGVIAVAPTFLSRPMYFIDQTVLLGSTTNIVWADASDAWSGTQDLKLYRDAAGILAQRNSTNAQTLRVYNTYTDSSNYERGIFDWNGTSNVLTIGTEAAGTGTARALNLTAVGGGIQHHGPAHYFYADGDANPGINFFGNNGPAIAYLRSTFIWAWCPGTGIIGVSPDTGISRSAAGVIAFGNGSGGDASATIKAKTKAGAPSTSDVPDGTWALIRDTSGATTKLYYNNGGSLQSVALT